MATAKSQQASWTKTSDGWQIIVEFVRQWEAPKVGTGKGKAFDVILLRKGEYTPKKPNAKVRLTSRVFEDKKSHALKAFAEMAEEL